jgi:hypothetical protein
MTWMHILHFDVLDLAVWPSRFSAMNSTEMDDLERASSKPT